MHGIYVMYIISMSCTCSCVLCMCTPIAWHWELASWFVLLYTLYSATTFSSDTRDMSKKKQQKNGFFYFMLDMQQDLRERGRNVPIRSMAAIAGPKWASLPDAQKQAYNQRAKNEKAGVRGGGGAGLMSHLGREVPRYERMDCTGQKLSVSANLNSQTDVSWLNFINCCNISSDRNDVT